MKAETLLIYPKGTVSERVLVVVSAKILAAYVGTKIAVLWDHEIGYSNLFLDGVDLLSLDQLNTCKYIYNPNIDQALIYNQIEPTANATYAIVQSNTEIRHQHMSKHQYLMHRTLLYHKMLTQDISGILLGQLNLFDAHYGLRTYCFTDAEDPRSLGCKIPALTLPSKDLFDIINDEMYEYVCSVLCSRASLLLVTREELGAPFYFASQISEIPVVCVHPNGNPDSHAHSINATCKDFLDYSYVINPDFNKISLLI